MKKFNLPEYFSSTLSSNITMEIVNKINNFKEDVLIKKLTELENIKLFKVPYDELYCEIVGNKEVIYRKKDKLRIITFVTTEKPLSLQELVNRSKDKNFNIQYGLYYY